MKFVTKLWIAALAITGILMTSCQKDQSLPVQVDTVKVEEPQEKPTIDALRAAYPTIKKGRLAFSSRADFKTYMGLVGKYSIADIEALNQEKGFKSHFAKTHKEEENTNSANLGGDDKEESAKYDIPDPYFAETLDENREVAVGEGTICRAGNDFSFTFPDGQSYLIDAFYQDYERGSVTVPEDGTFIGDLFVYPTAIEAPNVGGTKVRDIFKSRVRDNQPFAGSAFRLYGEMWQGNWIVYASSGTKSECNRTKTVFWITYYVYTNANKLSVSPSNVRLALSVDAMCNPISGLFNFPVSTVSGVNTSCESKRFEWQTAILGGTIGGPNGNQPTFSAASINKIVKGSTSIHTGTLNGSTKSFSLVWTCP
jgi:hypothetical protein